MSEAFLERLSRFTPDAGGLDRDALLFAAGRSSARPNRGWMTLASLLAGTQTLSLVLLWPHPTPPASGFCTRNAERTRRHISCVTRVATTWLCTPAQLYSARSTFRGRSRRSIALCAGLRRLRAPRRGTHPHPP